MREASLRVVADGLEVFGRWDLVLYYDLARGLRCLDLASVIPRTTEVFYESLDGTRVHMFVAYRRGLEPDGERIWSYREAMVPEAREVVRFFHAVSVVISNSVRLKELMKEIDPDATVPRRPGDTRLWNYTYDLLDSVIKNQVRPAVHVPLAPLPEEA